MPPIDKPASANFGGASARKRAANAVIVSAWVGISLSRTITSAVHDLYEATVRIRQGDLTHRIQVNGNDQLAELGTSFNIMSGNLERLLAAAALAAMRASLQHWLHTGHAQPLPDIVNRAFDQLGCGLE